MVGEGAQDGARMNNPEAKKTLRVFGWASFLNDFGGNIIFPLWPTFLTGVLGANMAVVGLVDGLGDAVVSISQAVSGYFSDKIGKRKVFVWVGYLCAGLARAGYALSSAWPQIIPFRILDRAGKMRGAPRDAIIADISTGEDRGRNFGFVRMMDNLGAVFGVLFALFFFTRLGYNNLFVVAAVPSLLGAFFVFRAVRERPRAAGAPIFKGFSFAAIHRDLRWYLLLSTLFSLSSFSYSFLLIYAEEFGFAVAAVPVLFLIYNAVASAVSIPFGKLADKIQRKPVLICSFVFWILACVFFIFVQNIAGIILAFLLYGLHLGALDPVQRAFVSELAEPELRASTLGSFQMVTGLAALPASLIAGFLWDRVGISAPFYFSAALTILALAMLLFVKENRTASFP